MSRGRARALKLAALALSTLVALTLAELGLRFYRSSLMARSTTASAEDLREQLERSRTAPLEEGRGGPLSLWSLVQPSSHSELVYELKPNLDGRFKGAVVRTNSWGFRGDETSIEKPPDTFRIVGLGDSMMFGWGVDQDKTYLRGLQRRLNEQASAGADANRFEVLNFAVPGYNTVMEVETLAVKAGLFDPDLVVLHFFSNDFHLPYFMQPPRPASGSGLVLLDLLRAALGSNPAPEPELSLLHHDMGGLTEKEKTETWQIYAHMEGEQAFRDAMSRLARWAGERSIPVVVLLPVEEHGKIVRETASADGLSLLETRSVFAAYLSERGLGEDQWAATFQLSERDKHPNELGHEIFAEALAQFLTDRALVPLPVPPAETRSGS